PGEIVPDSRQRSHGAPVFLFLAWTFPDGFYAGKIPLMRAIALLLLAAAAQAAPCINATKECTEWIKFNGGPSRSLIYRTYALDQKNENITRALIMVHGAGRDADNYFRTAIAAAFLAGALDDTVVVAPRFASNEGRGCADKLAANEVNWPCGGD